MRRTSSDLLWWGLVLLTAMACTHKEDEAAPMTKPSDNEILERVTEIAGRRPFRAGDIEKLTGASLEKVDAESNAYFTVFRAAEGATPMFTAVEVRSPTDRSIGKGGMVLLDVSGECVTKAVVGDRFGKPESAVAEPPRHGMPADSPAYFVYRQDWGVVRLGFSRATKCLAKVVLDAN